MLCLVLIKNRGTHALEIVLHLFEINILDIKELLKCYSSVQIGTAAYLRCMCIGLCIATSSQGKTNYVGHFCSIGELDTLSMYKGIDSTM